jgi:hypothetical protein
MSRLSCCLLPALPGHFEIDIYSLTPSQRQVLHERKDTQTKACSGMIETQAFHLLIIFPVEDHHEDRAPVVVIPVRTATSILDHHLLSPPSIPSIFSANSDQQTTMSDKVKTQKRHQCSYCDYNGRFHYLLDDHVRVKHTRVNLIPCEEPGCLYKAVKPYHLYQHVIQTHSTDRHPCPVSGCNYQSKTTRGLNSHHKHVHSDYKGFACDYEGCDYRTKTNASLLSHKMFKHNEERNFPCPDCGFRAKVSRILKKHQRNRHSDARKFVCPEENCEYRAKTPYDLRMHRQNRHSDDKRFTCDQEGCDFQTKNQPCLLSHKKFKHSGERTFKCLDQACNYRAKTRGCLTQHHKKHNVDQPLDSGEADCRDKDSEAAPNTELDKTLNSCLIDVHMTMQML